MSGEPLIYEVPRSLPETFVRAVFFDAVGTLIYPHPPVQEVYTRIGRRWGSELNAAEIERRFRLAFGRQEELDCSVQYRTDEDRERRRWEAIVSEVFHDQPLAAGPFQELWDHFSRPDAWACFAEVASLLECLQARGVQLGIASNYDARLRSVVAGLPALRPCTHLAISSEIGWRKPAPQFFAALSAAARVAPSETLIVGDDRINDYEAGRSAGLQALWLCRKGSPTAGPGRHRLEELPGYLRSLSHEVLPHADAR